MTKPANAILVLLVVGVIFASGCVAQGPQERNNNAGGQYSNQGSQYPSSQMQGNGSGPTIGRVDTGGYDLLPLNTCPDKILSQNSSQPKTILLATLGGKTYAVQGEDWIRTNCNPNLWIFQEAKPNKTISDVLDNLPSCGNNYALFSVAPVDISKIGAIVPLGNFNPARGHIFPTDHVYIDGFSGALITSNLYSPGNGWIVEIRMWDRQTEGFTDYDVYFAPCKEVVTLFGHVKSLSQKLNDSLAAPYDKVDEYAIAGKTSRTYTKVVNLSVSANEVLGIAGADWGTYDRRAKNVFANPARWQSHDYANAACPIDYYTADVKASLEAKLGKYDGSVKRTVAPVCGQVDQDVPNTAQGIWVVKGKDPFPDVGQEANQLTLAHDNVDPSKGDIVVNSAISGLSAGYYTFTPSGSGFVNRDFKYVTADGNIYCYDASMGPSAVSVIIQLTSPSTLRAGTYGSSCGSGPWSFSQYTDFER